MGVFPNELSNILEGITEIEACHINDLEIKVGKNDSLVPSTLDYKLKNPSSTDPGHKHTAGAFTGGFDADVFFKDPADHLWKPVGPDSAGLVAKTGYQVIDGVKTFVQVPLLPATDPLTANEATRKGYVDAQDALKVAKAGDSMTGPLAMGSNNITGVGNLEAATAVLTTSLTVPTLYGSAAEGGDLTLHSTSHPTKGQILFGANSGYDQLNDNLGIGALAFGTGAVKNLGLGVGTAPSTYPADMVQMWAADIEAGHCAPHFATELGKVIKLYQQSHIEDAKVDYTTGDLDTEAELITAFNTTNGKFNSLLTVLENLGLLATS